MLSKPSQLFRSTRVLVPPSFLDDRRLSHRALILELSTRGALVSMVFASTFPLEHFLTEARVNLLEASYDFILAEDGYDVTALCRALGVCHVPVAIFTPVEITSIISGGKEFHPNASIPPGDFCKICYDRARRSLANWQKIENERVFQELMVGLPPDVPHGMFPVVIQLPSQLRSAQRCVRSTTLSYRAASCVAKPVAVVSTADLASAAVPSPAILRRSDRLKTHATFDPMV